MSTVPHERARTLVRVAMRSTRHAAGHACRHPSASAAAIVQTARRLTWAAAWLVPMLGRAVSAAPVALPTTAGSADPYPRNPAIDALHYAFTLTLSDTTDAIVGSLTADFRIAAAGVTALRLDLVAVNDSSAGKGMTVRRVLLDGAPVRYTHRGEVLEVPLATVPSVEQRLRLVVEYSGTPASGLRVGTNRHGDRTFFSDNWPTRARHWLPTIDHPSDKATSEFIVTAPSHYQVVSNGRQVESTDVPGGQRRTHWRNSVPISPWLYVLGVARFAVQLVDHFEGKPIETWVFPQDRDAGFGDFATPTKQVLAFYSDYVGPFVYERLANIQATSVSGGMESASAILYNERSVTGTRSERWRNVVIHEIAHQWFGNAVTESTWDDVWLSEGFATYFTLLFIEHAYGRDEFLRGLEASRLSVLSFAAQRPDYTIVHRNLQRMEDVTTSQTYQKGSWTLHMLRGVVGPAAFQAGIRRYYQRHMNGTASTADFRRAMEEASGQSLDWFFDQFLYRPGHLRLTGSWRYDAAAKMIDLELTQTPMDGRVFTMPIEVAIHAGTGAPTVQTVRLSERVHRVRLPSADPPERVVLDPQRWVLMEATLERRP